MTSIRVPDTISKMSPSDTYPVVDGVDVGGFTDLKNEVNSNTSKIETNIDNINAILKAGKTTVINNVGDSTPQWDSEAHGNYLLVQRGQTQTVTVETPDPTGGMLDGALFTIYNESPTQAVRLTPGDPSDTLNSASATNIPPENFASFVYQLKDRNFLQLESGYIPAARINIANYVENKLNADGKLHTESELETAGFLKGLQVSGDGVSNTRDIKWIHFDGAKVSAGKPNQAVVTVTGGAGLTPTEAILHFQTITERNQWASTDGSKYTEVVCVVDANDDGDPQWFKWSGGSWSDYNPVDLPSGTSGIELDDGTSDAAGLSKIHLKGMKLTELPNQGSMGPREAELTSGINWHMAAPDQQYGSALANEVIVYPPLNTYISPNQTGAESVVLEIKPGTFEPMNSPSYLAYLQEEVEVVGKIVDGSVIGHPKGAVWLDDIVVPSGPYILTDRTNKTYGIQEADELDPNVTGGMNYLVIWRVALKGKAPDDGYVRAYIAEKQVGQQGADKYLEDVNGHPMVVQRHYKAGEELGYLQVMGIVNAKSIIEFQLFAEDNFADDNLTLSSRDQGATGLMIQAIKSDDKTGRAYLQFMHDAGQSIIFDSHYLGSDRMSIAWITQQDIPITLGQQGQGQTLNDGVVLENLSPLKMGTENNRLIFEDDGSSVTDFYFGKVFGADETRMLRGKQITVTTTLTDKDMAWRVGLFKWTGIPDETTKIYSSRNNESLVLNTGWTQVDSLFISEDVVTGDHTETKDFTVPADANNYAIAIYPVAAQNPMRLELKELNVDVKEPFTGVVLRDPELVSEQHLIFSDEYKEFSQTAQGYESLRYTINNSPDTGLPMPIGVTGKGLADIELDTTASVANIPSSTAKGGEGCLKFNADGNVHVVTGVKLWNEQPTDTTVKFWWAEVSPDGSTVTELADSIFTATVKAGAKGDQYYFAYNHDVERAARWSLRASADKADGAFLEATASVSPSVSNKITFKELEPVGGDDPFADVDLSQFDKVHTGLLTAEKFVANASSVVFNMDIPMGMNLSVIEAIKQLPNGDVRPVRALDWVYSNNNKTLTVSFGETVALGAVTIGVYV